MENLNYSTQEVNKVYKTNELEMFKQIGGNRPPNPQHVKRLVQSIKENGILCNPILVNEKMEVIDGQHRLMAAIETKSSIYYIVLSNYGLKQVHALNLNQKNWTKKDFMLGYADMGIKSYQLLKDFCEKNKDFGFTDCIAMCSNITTASASSISQKYRPCVSESVFNQMEVFEEGTWIGKDFKLAQLNADKIRTIKSFYKNYNRSIFVGTILGLLQNENFDFNEFLHKIKLQPSALVDCANREQTRLMIEEIYNYRSRNKVNLRY